MANTQLMDTPWLDILPPPVPADQSGWLLLVLSSLITMLLATAYVYWQRRPRQRALRELKQLKQQLEHGSLDHKLCLFAINRLLCAGLQQPQLLHFKPASLQHDWQAFYRELASRQYQAASPDLNETRHLLQSALRLLRHIRA